MKVVDLFSGAGGFGLGFEMAGYNVISSLEIDKWAAETIKQNLNHKVINDDITKFNTLKKIVTIVDDQPDVIIGGPPCQGFSLAGRRKIDDKRNKLYLEYFNWVKLLKPQIFVIENVSGILNFKDEDGNKIIDDIKQKFESIGYFVNIWFLKAEEYGVPQFRRRVFIVGNRHGVSIPVPPITHSSTNNVLSKLITVGDAILDLPLINSGEGNELMRHTTTAFSDYQRLMRGDINIVHNHVAMKHTKRVISRFQSIIDNVEIDKDSMVKKRNGNGELSEVNYSLNNRYLSRDNPSFTVPAHFYSSFVHPRIARNLTAREAARIQSFPDWYKFHGARTLVSAKLLKKIGKDDHNFLSQYNQIGNAVPPLLARRIAEYLRNYLY